MYKITSIGVEFPENELRVHFPDASLPATLSQGDLDFLGLEIVPDPEPTPPTPEELAAQAIAEAQAFQQEVVSCTQSRLDAFARTRNYDGILSACTYATSTVPKFASEGQYAVNARDITWATLYTLMGDVQAGTRTMPATVEEVLALLPELTWPV